MPARAVVTRRSAPAQRLEDMGLNRFGLGRQGHADFAASCQSEFQFDFARRGDHRRRAIPSRAPGTLAAQVSLRNQVVQPSLNSATCGHSMQAGIDLLDSDAFRVV